MLITAIFVEVRTVREPGSSISYHQDQADTDDATGVNNFKCSRLRSFMLHIHNKVSIDDQFYKFIDLCAIMANCPLGPPQKQADEPWTENV